MRKLTRQFRAAISILFSVVAILFFLAPIARPDTIILHNGAATRKLDVGTDSTITFTDAQGIQYNFPLRDVQSLVFTATNDIVTLRTGKVYSGHTPATTRSRLWMVKASATNFRPRMSPRSS